MMSPLSIEVMLQCYCSPEPWRNAVPAIWNSPAAQQSRDYLQGCGLIDGELQVTSAGRAFVVALCSVADAMSVRPTDLGVTISERPSDETMR